MKKIINGKKYDTDTAKFLGRYSNTWDTRNFHYYSEELYRKKNGEYFLYGEGGPMSDYSRQTATNERSGGERITPMTEAEARKWAEEHLDGDEYEEIFGEVDEEDDGLPSVKAIAQTAGLNQRELARRFDIPYRSVENWCSGTNQCPPYVKKMMMELLGQTAEKE